MQNSNNFPEAIPRTPVLVEGKGGEREVCFCSPKIYWNYLTTMQNTNFFPGITPLDPCFKGEEEFSFSENVLKLSNQIKSNQKIFIAPDQK